MRKTAQLNYPMHMEYEISRRAMLAGVGASILSPGLIARAIKPKPVGWAILGLGSYATNQIMPAFAHCENSKLVALISGHSEKLDKFGEAYGIPASHRYSYDSMDAIKANPDIDVVYIITPPATHPDFCVRAAAAGKHVCSEKPMAPTVTDCQRMIDACKKANKLLQIGYRCHYENHNIRAIKACRSGELGKLESLSSAHGFYMPAGTWRTQRALSGGGSMMDIGIYAVNSLRYLSGEEPVEVSATIKNPPGDSRFADVEDDVDFRLTFPSGLVGHGTSGYSWQQYRAQFEAKGSKGHLIADPGTAYSGDRVTIDGAEVAVTPNNQWAAQMDHLSERVRNGGRVLTPGEEGLRDIRVIQAIYESAKTGKPVKFIEKR